MLWPVARLYNSQGPRGVCVGTQDTDGAETNAAETHGGDPERPAAKPLLPDRHWSVAAERQGCGEAGEALEGRQGQHEGV